MDNDMDPIIVDLLKWLQDNLPSDVDQEQLARKVRRVDKIFNMLLGFPFNEFYNYALTLRPPRSDSSIESNERDNSLENEISHKLQEMREYLSLNHEKQMKTKKLDESRSKLELKREQNQLITSIRLNGCLDLISRYNHLITKK